MVKTWITVNYLRKKQGMSVGSKVPNLYLLRNYWKVLYWTAFKLDITGFNLKSICFPKQNSVFLSDFKKREVNMSVHLNKQMILIN